MDSSFDPQAVTPTEKELRVVFFQSLSHPKSTDVTKEDLSINTFSWMDIFPLNSSSLVE
jgi:hypothetical protein